MADSPDIRFPKGGKGKSSPKAGKRRTGLTQARLRELLIYDQFDGRWTWVRSRGHLKAGAVAGIDGKGYWRIGIDIDIRKYTSSSKPSGSNTRSACQRTAYCK
jgi:hypothetical protein